MKIFTGRCQSSTRRHQVVERQQARVALRAVGSPARVPGAVIQLAQLGQRHLTDQAGAGGRAVHPAVVHAHQMPVSGQPDIAFDAVGAFLEGELVGGQGVLGALGRRAAMGNHERVSGEHLVGRRHTAMLPVPGLPTQPEQPIRMGPRHPGHDHPAVRGPVDRLALEPFENSGYGRDGEGRKQVGEHHGDGVVGDALRNRWRSWK